MWAFLYIISVCVQKTSTIVKKGSLPLGPATNEGSRVRDLVDSLKREIPHGVVKCHEATKGTLSRQDLAVSNANRLRDCLGSLEKGAGREFTSGLRD